MSISGGRVKSTSIPKTSDFNQSELSRNEEKGEKKIESLSPYLTLGSTGRREMRQSLFEERNCLEPPLKGVFQVYHEDKRKCNNHKNYL